MTKRNVMRRISLGVLAAYLNLTSAHAFEVTTHAVITREAWTRFLGENPGALERLGIQEKQNAFDTDGYYDYRPLAGAVPIRRNIHSYEAGIMGNAIQPRSVLGWLVRGAIREDDDSNTDELSPKEDPYGEFHRVFSHFHDPVNNRGLTVGVTRGAKAADWALDPNAITPAFLNLPQRHNHFNLASFREVNRGQTTVFWRFVHHSRLPCVEGQTTMTTRFVCLSHALPRTPESGWSAAAPHPEGQ